MKEELVQIEFNFPEGKQGNTEGLVSSIVEGMEKTGSTAYSGYSDVPALRQGLLDHIGAGSITQYKPISEAEKNKIKEIISETIEKCNEKLTIPTKNFAFVNPFLTTEKDGVFEGVMAVATYGCVFHVFVDLDQYTKGSLENTVAHELNHTIYYYDHYDNFGNYTLLDEILLEGLAENFREQYFDPKVTAWAGALSCNEALVVLNNSIHILDSRDRKTIREFLFGNDVYKRWTGYSAGYWLVKEFLKNNAMSWNEIMKLEPKAFLDGVIKNNKA